LFFCAPTWRISRFPPVGGTSPRQLCHQPDAPRLLISTTEHLLSVFYAMGIDNAYVEIDNLKCRSWMAAGCRSSPDRGSRHPAFSPPRKYLRIAGRFRWKTRESGSASCPPTVFA